MGDELRPCRSLILAGGGTKVAFQAGVLQAWLDEAELTFDHIDAASGGVLNLVMLCQGMTGTEVADNWRAYHPLRAIDPDLAQWLVLPFAKSLFRLGRFRRNVLGKWDLDWNEVRASRLAATFNLYDFTQHRHEIVEPSEMTEDKLISAISLPVWFPPVSVDGRTFVDAVFVTDANLEEAIRRGANEIWVIWTVSRRGRWGRGPVAHYFQMIEAMANGQLNAILARIERSNQALERNEHAEFDRRIDVRMLRSEVPLHYLLNFTHDRVRAAVELGVQAGRRWCTDEGIELNESRVQPQSRPCGIRFSEAMSGWVSFGAADCEDGAKRGGAARTAFGFRLDIAIDDLDRFVVRPEHEADARGVIVSDAFGGELAIERGWFNLFVDNEDPSDKRMIYRLWFRDAVGHPLTLYGHKFVRNDSGLDLWRDTTTLFTTVLGGHLELDLDGVAAEQADLVAGGVLRISPSQFARQLTTFRADAPTWMERMQALARFGRLFGGGLWDVYGRDIFYEDR
jgi:predicted acylesterase/phospholipase RssA